MITRDNFQKVLTKLGFTEDKKVFSKPLGSLA